MAVKEAIILAGGEGKRLKPVIGDLPKILAPIGEQPFINYLLRNLSEVGIKRFILALGKGKHLVKDYCRKFLSKEDFIFSEETRPLGTGGALRKALEKAKSLIVLASNGDSLVLSKQLRSTIESLAESDFPIGIIGLQVENTYRFGRMVVDKKTKKLLCFQEKYVKGPGIINSGLYVLKKELLLNILPPKNYPFLFEEWLEKKIRNDDIRVGVEVISGYFVDIGIPEDYSRAQRELR